MSSQRVVCEGRRHGGHGRDHLVLMLFNGCEQVFEFLEVSCQRYPPAASADATYHIRRFVLQT